MGFPSVKWVFEVNAIMNIVHAQAIETKPSMQPLMLYSASKLIEKAEKYHGVPYDPQPIYPGKGTYVVHFSLIFKSPTDIKEFFEQLQKGK